MLANTTAYDGGYGDFNTHYYLGNAAATLGSSGGPVVDKNSGSVLAMQSGGCIDGKSADYFLPLDRPLRALKLIQSGKTVPRGDIQCQFLLESLNCRHQGLTTDQEEKLRRQFPGETNFLVARRVLPTGPSHNRIEVGDVLVRINGELVQNFAKLDDILDSNVGRAVSVVLQREGEMVEVEIEVGDLHKITPDQFVSVVGTNFHHLSYIKAMVHGVAPRGVVICQSVEPISNTSDDCVIEIPDLERFVAVMKKIPDQKQVLITCKSLKSLSTSISGR